MNRRELLAGLTGGALIFSPGVRNKIQEVPHHSEWNKSIKEKDKEDECKAVVKKALDILQEVTGFTPEKCNEIRKAIAKRTEDLEKYYKEVIVATKREYISPEDVVLFARFWCALQVTFRTAGITDGFSVIDIEWKKRILEREYIAEPLADDLETQLYTEYNDRVKQVHEYLVDKIDEFLTAEKDRYRNAIVNNDEETLEEIRQYAHRIARGIT